MSKAKKLKELIEKGGNYYDQMMDLVDGCWRDYNEAESLLHVALATSKTPSGLMDQVRFNFKLAEKYYYEDYGLRPRGLHYLDKMKLKYKIFCRIKWLKEAWITAEFVDKRVADLRWKLGSLVGYDHYSIDFSPLTLEQVKSLKLDEHSSYAKARVEAGRFETEEAHLRWRVRQPGVQKYSYCCGQDALRDIKEIQSTLQRLEELDADISEFDGFLEELLTKRLAQLEAYLSGEKERDCTKDCGNPPPNQSGSESLKKNIKWTRAALHELSEARFYVSSWEQASPSPTDE